MPTPPARVPVRASTVLVTLLLVLCGCGGDPPFRATEEFDLGEPAAVRLDVAPDGRLITVDSYSSSVRGVRVVDAEGEVTDRIELPGGGAVGFTFLVGETLVTTAETETPGGFMGMDLHVLDRDTGESTEIRSVTPFPDHAHGWATHPTVTPDGRLLVAASSSAAPPDLLVVDPLTGTVTDTVAITGGPLDDVELWDVHGIAVSPDGSRIAVVIDVFDRESLQSDTVAVVLDDRFQQVNGPVPMGPSTGSAQPFGLDITDEGTVYAAVAGALVTVPVGSDRARTITEVEAAVDSLVVAGGAVWFGYAASAATDAEFAGVQRIDLGEEEATSSAVPCSGETLHDLGRSPDASTVYAAWSCDGRAILWAFAAA